MISPPLRPIYQRLAFQKALVLAVVLLPLTVISMVMAGRAISETQARSEAALTGETVAASANEVRMIQEARGAVAALAAVVMPLIPDDATCSAAMARIAALQPQYSQVSFVPKDGQLRCSSTGRQFDVSDSLVFQSFVQSERPGFAVNRNGQISGTSVLGISHPVFDQTGVYLGYVGVSLPHSKLDIVLPRPDPDGLLQLMTFDRNGEILVASGGLENAGATLPRDRSLVALMGEEPLAFSADSVDGELKVYSVVPVVPGELYTLGTWPQAAASGFADLPVSLPLFLPLLVWIASLIAAVLSVEYLVNRHIRRLNKSIQSFAAGDRTLTSVDVTGAPLELREMAAAFELMTDSVMRDEAELEDTVHQKEVLLREVHHRVKNNLQMIASIMNMHVRKARTPETRDVIKGLQGRVMSLATIHRELYQTSGVSDVHAAELLDAIARQTVNVAAGPDRRIDLRLKLDDIRMTPDQAVPLALLVGEGLMGGVRYAMLQQASTTILNLKLTRSGPDSAMMEISGQIEGGSGRKLDADDEALALSAQLMAAFAMQLDGKLDHSFEGDEYILRVDFKLRPLVEAEFRHAAKTADPVGAAIAS